MDHFDISYFQEKKKVIVIFMIYNQTEQDKRIMKKKTAIFGLKPSKLFRMKDLCMVKSTPHSHTHTHTHISLPLLHSQTTSTPPLSQTSSSSSLYNNVNNNNNNRNQDHIYYSNSTRFPPFHWQVRSIYYQFPVQYLIDER